MPHSLMWLGIPAVALLCILAALVLVSRRIQDLERMATVTFPCPGCEQGQMAIWHANDGSDLHWWQCHLCGLVIWCCANGDLGPSVETEPLATEQIPVVDLHDAPQSGADDAAGGGESHS